MSDVLYVQLAHRVIAMSLVYLGAVDNQMKRAALRREQEVRLFIAREQPRAWSHALDAPSRVYLDAVSEL